MKSEFMKFKLLLSVLLVLLNSFASAQTMQDVNPNPRYRIALNTVDGSSMKGLLIGIEDSAIILFPGALKQWKSNAEVKTMEIGYTQIRKIYLKKKNGLLRGMLIGTGAGLTPLLAAIVSDENSIEGAGYVMMVTVPLGIVTGGIVGATFKKKFIIQGKRAQFDDFKKRISKC